MAASASGASRALALLAGVALGWYLSSTWRRSRELAAILRRARELEADVRASSRAIEAAIAAIEEPAPRRSLH